MKTILCYGDSNVRGNIPLPLDLTRVLYPRHSKNKRWTGILQKILGEDYDVIEEGMGSRTTNLDEIVPGRPYKNGLTQLPVCLESHQPIDLVILLLGSNDTKIQFNRAAVEIAEGLKQLILVIKNSDKGLDGNPPKILIIAPPPMIAIPTLHPHLDQSSVQKSKELAGLYQQMAELEGCEFLDAGQVITSSEIDGIHLDESQCELLARALAEKIVRIF